MSISKETATLELAFTVINTGLRLAERVKDGEDIPDSELETLRQLVNKREDEFLSE